MNSNTTLYPHGQKPWRGRKMHLSMWLVAMLIAISLSSHAQVALFSFNSTTGTYTPITGGTALGDASSDDEMYVDPTAPLGGSATSGSGFPIGFNFRFNGATFDRFGINANGWIFLGQSALTPAVNAGGGTSTPLSSTTAITPAILRSRISAYSRDLQGQTGSNIRFETTGTAPNRVLVVQWTNYRRYSFTPIVGENMNFQIRLEEGTNKISLVYGTMVTTATSNTAQVGVGGSAAADFNNRTSTTSWTASAPGTTNSASMTHITTVGPPSGLTYEFTQPTCFPPSAVAVSNITGTGAQITWVASNSSPSSYEYVVSTSNTTPTSGTSAGTTTVTVTGLTPSTGYYVFVRSVCGGADGNSSWTPAFQFTTTGPVASAASGLWSNPATWANGAVPNANTPVTISPNDSVILDVTTAIPSLTVNGVLGVNAAVQRVLTVNGPTNVNASGSINFGVPTTGTGLRLLELRGAFNHSGNSNFANGNAVLSFIDTLAGNITIGGTLTNNAVGQLLINNPAGYTLNTPLVVGFNLDLIAGAFNVGSNLTFDQAAVTGTSSQVRRSPLGSLVGNPTFTSSVYNVQYVFFTGQTSALITEGPEIPPSRSINAFTISNPAGVNLTGNLTLTAAATALTLTNGIIHLPTGGKIITTNGGYSAPTGSATSFVNGSFEAIVNTTTGSTRNFPVGSVVNGIPVRGHVILGSVNTAGTAQTILVSPVGTPSGGGVAPLTTAMGPRAYRITSTGSIGTTATVALNWDLQDALSFISNLDNIRIGQAASLTGPWTARSATASTGSLTGTGTRTSTAINLANGEFFAWGTVAGRDLAVNNLVRPIGGECFGQSETAVAVLRNEGPPIDRAVSPITVRGTITTPGGSVINLTPVVRNTGTFALAQTDTITFTDALNLADSGNYVFRIFIDSISASAVRTNDTLVRTIRSDAWTARAVPSIIATTQSANLQVLRNGVPAAQAGVFARNQALVRISEMVAFRTGTGAQPLYPSYIPAGAQDFIEITNFGDTIANLSGWNLEIFGEGARAYTFPANVTLAPRGVLVLHVGPGTDDPANRYYNTGGVSDGLFSTSVWGVTLRNAGTLVDAVAFRGFQFPATANVTAADWSGNSSTTSSAGMMLVNFDNNAATNWVISTASLFTNIGSFNPNVSFALRSITWAGPGGFTANGAAVSSGPRNSAANEQYTATISAVGNCNRTAVANLQIVVPVTPIAGFSVSADTVNTGGIVGTLTLTDTSLNFPFSRRWTITPNTFVFVNSTNDSSVAPQVQFTAAGNYTVRLRVSNPAGVDSVTRPTPIVARLAYCASNATSTADTKIDSVILGTTVTGSASSTCQTYTDFTNLGVAADIVKGRGFAMSVRSGYCGTSAFAARGRVFVDANKNGVFEASEAVANFGPPAATGSGAAREWFNFQIYVPGTADTGITRMRIVYQQGAATFEAITGCGTYTNGETEDYNIRLVNPSNASDPFLLAPANNAFVNVNGPASSVATINWNRSIPFNGTAQSAVRYSWQLANRITGSFSAPLLSLASNSNGADTALVLNFQQLDAALAGLGVAVGDTVRGMWRVRAIVGNDTVHSFQTWNIDLRRGTVTDALAAFNLLAPANGTVLPVAGPGSQSVSISWNRSIEGNSNPVTYQWLAIAPGGSFNTPTVALNSNNNGADTVLTLTYAQIDALLASLNFNVGDSAILDWTVRATSGSFNRLAVQTWRVRLFRGGIAPLRLAIAPVGTTTTQVRAPNGLNTHTFLRAATFVPASELAAAGIDSGESIVNLSFRLTAGASVPNKGRFVLYLGNGQNTTYSRGTAWPGVTTGLVVRYDDSLSLLTTAGLMTLQLSQPFVYTGGSIEIAYDWAAVAPFAVSPGIATYAANSAIAGSLVSAASATAVPATLAATAFRPEFVWGVDDRKANEAEVITMYAKGRNPRQWGSPEVVQAIVRNNGFQVRNNLAVTLNVAGANTFTNTQTIATLGIDSVATVNFANFSGTALGFNNMTVSVPNDDVNANNSKSWVQQQTDSIFSYNDSSLAGLGGVGYNTGSGLLLTRYTVNGQRSVRAARMRISNTAAIIGNGLYAVVLNDSGIILAQSAPRVIAAADTNQWVVFTFPNPVNINNGSFYIGMAQPANATTGYFPMAFQTENPTRANAYFTAALNGTGLAPVGGFRLMIEAHVGATVIPVDSLSRFSLVAPGNNTVVNLQGDPTQTVNIRWNQSRRSVGTTPVTYQWLLDVPGTTFTNPVVRVNAGTDTSLTLTYGQIVDTLASRGVAVGAGFVGRWTVRASSDSLNRLATLPFNITLNRGVMTSIEETDFSKSIVIYPNPAAYTAKLQVTGSDKDLAITVVNAVGQEMKKFTVNSGVRNEIEIDLANLNEGLYFVRISDGSNMAIKRLMIQR